MTTLTGVKLTRPLSSPRSVPWDVCPIVCPRDTCSSFKTHILQKPFTVPSAEVLTGSSAVGLRRNEPAFYTVSLPRKCFFMWKKNTALEK